MHSTTVSDMLSSAHIMSPALGWADGMRVGYVGIVSKGILRWPALASLQFQRIWFRARESGLPSVEVFYMEKI